MMKIKLETIANGLIIVTSLACIGALSTRFLIYSPASNKRTVEGYRIGDKLTSSEVPVDFSKAPRTLILVMSSQCHFCTASMPFYRELLVARTLTSSRTRVVAAGLVEKTTSLQAYLQRNNLIVDEIVTVTTKSTKFRVTPTVILVDQSGVINGVWTGALSTEQDQKDVTNVVKTGHA